MTSETDHLVKVPNFWGAQQCSDFIAAAEARGIVPAAADYPPHYRNNDRQVLDDKALADAMFTTLAPHLPPILLDERGARWRPVAINWRFRLCRYRSGQFFGRHRDGVFHEGKDRRSMLSLLVYLNGPEALTGGRTRFFATQASTDPSYSMTPETGLLFVFPHEVWHDGEPLERGEKYVLRSDVIFECLDVSNADAVDDHRGYVWQVLPLGGGRFVTGGRDRRIVLWELESNGVPRRLRESNPQEKSVTCLERLSPEMIVAGSRDCSLVMLDIGSFCGDRIGNAHAATITALAVLPGGRFVSACAGGVIAIRDGRGRPLHTWKAHVHWIWGLTVVDNRIISIAEDGTIAAWDQADGARIGCHRFLGRTPSVLARNADETLAVGFLDGGIEVGHFVQDWEPSDRWQAHDHAVRAIASVGGAWLSGGEDHAVKRRDPVLRVTECISKRRDFVRSIAVVGNHIIVVGYDGRFSQPIESLSPPQDARFFSSSRTICRT